MYTGIVQAIATIRAIERRSSYQRIEVVSPSGFCDATTIGASVSIDGTCLSATAASPACVAFDISDRTAGMTTLGSLLVGQNVNIERSHRSGDENGGHALYGHVDGRAKIVGWDRSGETVRLVCEVSEKAIAYCFAKGFIGLQGCSLTIDDVDEAQARFSINLIPETLRQTTFQERKRGEYLNYEVNQTTRVLVDTVSRVLRDRFKKTAPYA